MIFFDFEHYNLKTKRCITMKFCESTFSAYKNLKINICWGFDLFSLRIAGRRPPKKFFFLLVFFIHVTHQSTWNLAKSKNMSLYVLLFDSFKSYGCLKLVNFSMVMLAWMGQDYHEWV